MGDSLSIRDLLNDKETEGHARKRPSIQVQRNSGGRVTGWKEALNGGEALFFFKILLRT